MTTRTCRHDTSLWGRCTACGLTWAQQAAIQQATVQAWLAAEQEAHQIARSGRIFGQLVFNHPGDDYHELAMAAIEGYRASDRPWRGDVLAAAYWRQRCAMVSHDLLVWAGWAAADADLFPGDPMCLAVAHWV